MNLPYVYDFSSVLALVGDVLWQVLSTFLAFCSSASEHSLVVCKLVSSCGVVYDVFGFFSFLFSIWRINVNNIPAKGPNWIMYSIIINSNIFHTWLLYPVSPCLFQMCSIPLPLGLFLILASRVLWNFIRLFVSSVAPLALCSLLFLLWKLSVAFVCFGFFLNPGPWHALPLCNLNLLHRPPLDVPHQW